VSAGSSAEPGCAHKGRSPVELRVIRSPTRGPSRTVDAYRAHRPPYLSVSSAKPTLHPPSRGAPVCVGRPRRGSGWCGSRLRESGRMISEESSAVARVSAVIPEHGFSVLLRLGRATPGWQRRCRLACAPAEGACVRGRRHHLAGARGTRCGRGFDSPLRKARCWSARPWNRSTSGKGSQEFLSRSMTSGQGLARCASTSPTKALRHPRVPNSRAELLRSGACGPAFMVISGLSAAVQAAQPRGRREDTHLHVCWRMCRGGHAVDPRGHML